MPILRAVSAVLVAAAGVVTATVCSAPVWAGGPGGVVETGVVSRAVGSGVRDGMLVGFSASGPTNEAASAAVIAVCQNAGAEQCSSDEVTNDVFCVVSVGADNGSGIVSGGAGPTVEAARDDAFRNVGRANLTLDPSARVLASSCP
ncbi:DUF4189 domain-containing protein [Mycolicibacterium austroafricanum]|jgi:hypothetical protein|uniref:DUF4189 domain-containing protein n=1 Tax=Mycolicibacterium austroafricanum TaxID=39687 RepID=A0ABT8HN97_MYCAO|nr:MULTISPECIES: DUF4189 domain-containing protein [Mycolicibacterium]MDN4522237.1 DUF4189 domain-containing protein [Mycolicibacterium austroafricanum]MDW5613297.1 DUF4189 domain-containing protein [Mycolicibacterium sp. D5.8-2]PQP52151.1 hypothetical protein C6A88_06540 [Mycolicibacterium austroafricanum]QRZ05835.1 DUF4189 domain-containing protein [Mycolicibacterium austroafricanum]QZT67389.1 DUF4189 domain-containing protein [Mycolicibacterium austroafricanum]